MMKNNLIYLGSYCSVPMIETCACIKVCILKHCEYCCYLQGMAQTPKIIKNTF